MRSLRARLLVTIGGSLLVLWTAVAVWMLGDVRLQLRAALDERLAASARMVAGLVSQLPAPGSPAPEGVAPLLDVVGRDGLACEVSLLRGEVAVQTVARTAGSPRLQGAPAGYSTREFGGKRWRMYVLDRGGVRVATADRLDMREGLVREAALAAALPFGVALAGTLVILWFAIGGGLAPLDRVRSVLERRRADDAAPLPAMPVPRELEPLVGTVGHLLQRVRGAIARERRFTDDAAHELRTPLTAIKTHLQVLRLACGSNPLPQAADAALAHAGEGVARMQRTLDQLLLLARLDADAPAPAPQACSALEAARHAVEDAEAARDLRGRVVIEAAGSSSAVAIDESLLISALRNLLDNALNAAPDGPVLLRIEAVAPALVAFTVLDEGPGLSPDECERAVERFWRRGTSGHGSGLGLAIVNTIALRHGGSFTLRPRREGGLEARIVLPAAASSLPGSGAQPT
jgi:two-component system, OmpR family, sensor histidine kinase QseC